MVSACLNVDSFGEEPESEPRQPRFIARLNVEAQKNNF